jgi:glyoxylase-like metal-dependent hydrolase (beta-lactamase superfamily II)
MHVGQLPASWVEIADGVCARRYAELNLTVGLVVGGERCLVVDTRGDLEQGVELATAVRRVTAVPWKLAVTHAHFDHCFGSAAFRHAARPAPIWAHRGCPPALAGSAERQRAEWAAHYRSAGDEARAAALAGTVPIPPDHLVDRAAELDLGDRIVRLVHLGAGHTDHDLVVHVPDAAVVYAGDLVEQGAPPDFSDARPLDWPATVERLLTELAPNTIVPGHGDPVGPEFVAAQREGLAEVAELYRLVLAGELDAEAAGRRSPFPGVPFPGPRVGEENHR